jgi:hypothetical protein
MLLFSPGAPVFELEQETPKSSGMIKTNSNIFLGILFLLSLFYQAIVKNSTFLPVLRFYNLPALLAHSCPL